MKAELLNQLSRNEATLAGQTVSADLAPPIIKTEPRAGNAHSWPCIVKRYNRGNTPHSGMTSSGYWTTYYTYAGNNQSYIQHCGFAWPNYLSTSALDYKWGGPHREMFSKDNMAGCALPTLTSNNNTTYPPFTTNLMFVKNTDTSSRTLSIDSIASAYWSSGYDGSTLSAVIPNSATKSSTTSVSFSQVWSRTGSSSTHTESGSVSVPAGTTIALIQTASSWYRTTFSYGGYWENSNLIGPIGSWPSYFEPDHDMHAAAFMCNNIEATSVTPTNEGQIAANWSFCASVFGD